MPTVKCSNCNKGTNVLPNAFAKKEAIECKYCGLPDGIKKPVALAKAPEVPAAAPKPAPVIAPEKAPESPAVPQPETPSKETHEPRKRWTDGLW
jgi:hypothetical protein